MPLPFRKVGLRKNLPSWGKAALWFFGGLAALGIVFIGLVFWWVGQVPRAYPPLNPPLPSPHAVLGGGLDGFDSPYLGHTGSWNGKGGTLTGGSKDRDLDAETAMGLRWTFMPVYWRVMEPRQPVDPELDLTPEWEALDLFVISAQKRGLNILMQAPVVGGNAGGPPVWAGQREKGKSAPLNMEALAAFAGKLAKRYSPGGTLAQRRGWGNLYGIRAWELDNEPESYRTSWKGQAGDYAEFVTLASAQIRKHDPNAVILGPGMAGGKEGTRWFKEALGSSIASSQTNFQDLPRRYSIFPTLNVISFHNYEGLDSAFAGEPRTIGQVAGDIRDALESWRNEAGVTNRNQASEFWHTEGNFDFIGALSAKRRAAWRFQWFARAFATGVRKVCVMDPCPAEQKAVQTFVRVLPNPFPMVEATREIVAVQGRVVAFSHTDGPDPSSGRVWVLWAEAGGEAAVAEVPTSQASVAILTVEGCVTHLNAKEHRVRLKLEGDAKMPAPCLLVDRSELP